MAILSKPIFEEHFAHLKCCELIHPWSPTCSNTMKVISREFLGGTIQFMFVVVMIQYLASLKKKNGKSWQHFVKLYVRGIGFGVIKGLGFIGGSCFFRKLFGRFHYYFTGGIPAFFAGAGLRLIPESQNGFIAKAFVAWSVETLLNELHFKNILNMNQLNGTALFMIVNSCLLSLLQKTDNIGSVFWILSPEKLNPNGLCRHNEGCPGYIAKSTAKYFGFFVALQLGKDFIKNLHLLTSFGGIQKFFGIISRMKKFSLALQISAYVALFRTITCYLRGESQRDKFEYTAIAGFIAGLSYLVKPSVALNGAALGTLLWIIVKRWQANNASLRRIPINVIIFMLTNGYLYHKRLTAPQFVPSFIARMMRISTRGRSEIIVKVVSERLAFLGKAGTN